MPHFTPTEQRMLDVLSDGQPHRRGDLHACLGDDLQPIGRVKVYICSINKKLLGEKIVCVTRNRTSFYQQFRQISMSE